MQQNGTREGLVSTIPSRALEVWQRLYRRYSLEPGPASVPPDVSKTIIPTTDADQLLRTPGNQQATLTNPGSGAGGVTFLTVPTGERWILYVIAIIQGASTTHTELLLFDPVEQQSTIVAKYAATADRIEQMASPTPLAEGVQLRVRTDGAAGNLKCAVWRERETMF